MSGQMPISHPALDKNGNQIKVFDKQGNPTKEYTEFVSAEIDKIKEKYVLCQNNKAILNG